MLIILLLLLLGICDAGPTYRECTQCNYVEQPKPFSADVNAISDQSFDRDCVGAGYTDFNYCLKKACNRDGDNSWNNFLHYPCEKYLPSVCPDCGEVSTAPLMSETRTSARSDFNILYWTKTTTNAMT